MSVFLKWKEEKRKQDEDNTNITSNVRKTKRYFATTFSTIEYDIKIILLHSDILQIQFYFIKLS